MPGSAPGVRVKELLCTANERADALSLKSSRSRRLLVGACCGTSVLCLAESFTLGEMSRCSMATCCRAKTSTLEATAASRSVNRLCSLLWRRRVLWSALPGEKRNNASTLLFFVAVAKLFASQNRRGVPARPTLAALLYRPERRSWISPDLPRDLPGTSQDHPELPRPSPTCAPPLQP